MTRASIRATIRAVDRVAALAPYALADMGTPGLTSLAQNESAFGPSPRAIAAGQAALSGAALYPDPDWGDLRAAIAEVHAKHGVLPDSLLCGAGSMELIGALIRAYAGPGDQVLGSAYGYLFVATAAAQAGAEYTVVPEPGMAVSCDLLLKAVTPQTRIVFLCNPGNPTGTRLDNAAIAALRARLPTDVLLVVDQAYGEFDDQDHTALFALPARGDTVILRTFSKAYGLAGARVGWGVFPPAIALELRKLMNPNNVSGASQAMAAAAMRDQAHMAQTVARTADLRDALGTALRRAGYHLPESHTNFVLIAFDHAEEARRADEALRAQGLLLRGMAGYGLPHCLRATIGPAEAMERLAQTLTRFRSPT